MAVTQEQLDMFKKVAQGQSSVDRPDSSPVSPDLTSGVDDEQYKKYRDYLDLLASQQQNATDVPSKSSHEIQQPPVEEDKPEVGDAAATGAENGILASQFPAAPNVHINIHPPKDKDVIVDQSSPDAQEANAFNTLAGQPSAPIGRPVGVGRVEGADNGISAGQVAQQQGNAPASIPEQAQPESQPAAQPQSLQQILNQPSQMQQDYQKALDERNQKQMFANIGAAANTFSGGLAKTGPVDNSFYDKLGKQAEQPLQDFQAKLELQKKDPQSDVSKGLRKYLNQQFGIKLSDDMNAEHVEKVAPWAIKAYEGKIAKESQLEQSKAQLKQAKLNHQESLAELNRHHLAEEKLTGEKITEGKNKAKTDAEIKADTKKSKDLDNYSNRIDETAFKSGSNRKVKETLDRISRLEPLVYDITNGQLDESKIRDLTDVEMKELAIGMAGALSGTNAPAQTTIEGLTPDTLRKRVSQWAQWFRNQPTGIGQQSFTQRFANTLKREKETNSNIILESALTKTATNLNEYKKYPDEIAESLANKLTAYGVETTPDVIKTYLDGAVKNPKAFLKAQKEASKGQKEPASLQADPVKQQKIQAFMKSNPSVKSEVDAEQILKQNGKL